jgi:hypothetical protein
MSLYRITPDKFDPIPPTTFVIEGVLERKHLQSLLRKDISPLGDDLMVIAEEYGEWEDSSRRIDLFCLSTSGDLVVVEIKRTEDGGHMELQAVRYASMVANITLEQVIQTLAKSQSLSEDEASRIVLDFLEADTLEEAELTGTVRIILASANFSTELTTAVLWLNKRDLDITCVRLRPYRMGNDILIDATQIIPLPEAKDFMVRLRAQEEEKKKVLSIREEILRKFWTQLIERSKAKTQLLAGNIPTNRQWISVLLPRGGFFLNTSLKKNEGRVECYIRMAGGAAMNKKAFKALLASKVEIEASFGGPLDWQELPQRSASRICMPFSGGWTSPEPEWPEIHDRIIDATIRLDAAVRKPIQDLKLS